MTSPTRSAQPPRLAPLLIVPIGAVLPLSAFAGGYYDSSIWAPAGLAVIAALVALLVARGAGPPADALAAVIALASLGGWALVSATWTDSVQQAVIEGNRLLVYAALLGLLVTLVTDDRVAILLLAGISGGAATVALVVVLRMLDGDESLLLSGRLNEPLGYVNGQASLFVLALWPCLGLAEQRRSVGLAGLGVGFAALLMSLVVLAQSRGAVMAVLCSAAVVLAVLPNRLRRTCALLILALGTAIAVPTLFDVYDSEQARGSTGDALRDAGVLALVVAAGTGIAWSALLALMRAVSESRPALAQRLRTALKTGLLLGVAIAGVWAAASTGRITDYVDRQYAAFVELGDPTTEASGSRLVAGAGNRYDYWRIAVDAWRADPIVGIGAGGFDVPYFAERATVEDIRQPHSLPLQVLTELGLVGAAVLVAFLLSVAAGARRRVQRLRPSGASVPIATAALGLFVGWLVHTSVDWMHLLPGLTGIALCGAAVLLRDDEAPKRPLTRRNRRAIAAVLGLVILVAAISLSRQSLAEHYRDSAQSALKGNPQLALEKANRALRLDQEDVASYYVKAAALARFGRAAESESVLVEATRREPHDFVTWALLGDLAVRRGELREARRHYGRALRLNPRDKSLRTLARDPASAVKEPAPR